MIQRALRSTIKALLLTIELTPLEPEKSIGIRGWSTPPSEKDPNQRADFFFTEACELARAAGLSEADMVDAVFAGWSHPDTEDIKEKLVDAQEALDRLKAENLN